MVAGPGQGVGEGGVGGLVQSKLNSQADCGVPFNLPVSDGRAGTEGTASVRRGEEFRSGAQAASAAQIPGAGSTWIL